ncbi:putative Vera protein [Seiridium unicorne]|uniref:Vera protein n=1 Tax=Seiridium unicorne TaxID=138068 RepID=A0ABR2USN3_9PEZI
MALGSSDVFAVVMRTTLLLVSFAIGQFLFGGYVVRSRFSALKKQGIPLMPHSMIWGHLKVLGEYTKAHPADVSTNHLSIWMVREWRTLFPGEERCPTVAYLDLWPVSTPILFSLHPRVSAQFTQTKSLPKHAMERDFLKPLTRNKDMVSSDGEQWKRWRSVFNPGFSPRNIMALVPSMMEDMVVFVNVLDSFAGETGQPGQIVQLEKLTTNLTFDIIGKATLGLQLNEQSGTVSALKEAMTDMTKRLGTRPSLVRFIALLNPWSRIKHNNQVMKAELMPHIHRHLESIGSREGTKSIMDLTTESIRKEGKEGDSLESDPQFLENILENLKAFLFAGHDTTATTICWAFKLLEENPECLAKLRQEHDALLGPNPDDAPELIVKSPHILNSLPYTMGCIKETLRLYTPAATARAGQPDFFLIDPVTNMRYPTADFGVGDGSPACHYRDDVWSRPKQFIPERWLVKDGDPLFPMKDAWRPFEQGPRNCIGQELATMELRLVLTLAARKFDINQVWAEWDNLRGHDGSKEVIDGERLYMVGDGTGHTKDETPVRITRRTIESAR